MMTSPRRTVIACGALAMVLVATPAHAASHTKRGHHFDGACTVEGTVTFGPPATITPQLLDVTYDATGTCSGTLDGRSVSAVPVRLHHHVESNGSCQTAQTTAPGPGRLVFQDGPTLKYTVEFAYLGTEGVVRLVSPSFGQAIGHGSYLTPDSSPDAAMGCVNGQGVH